MALIKFELKKEHITLLKNLKWSLNSDTDYIESFANVDEHGDSPFGGDNLVEDMYTILYGKPDDFDPLNDEGVEITPEQFNDLLELYKELPTALDIILYTSSFEPGHYKTKWYDRNWIKFTPKSAIYE